MSFPPPPSLRRTTTLVDAPVQLARMEFGSIGSLKVKTIVSFCSARPAIEPPFVVWISDADGAVLSTTTDHELVVAERPPASVAVME